MLKLDKLKSACLLASAEMISSIKSNRFIQVDLKSDDSLVTTLDLDSQKQIINFLGQELPVVCEEDVASHKLLGTVSEFYLVDPLDGTSACKRFRDIEGGQVGFGPILGYCKNGVIQAVAYFNLPTRRLFWASSRAGSFAQDYGYEQGTLKSVSDPKQLKPDLNVPLKQSAALFYPGTQGELKVLEKLRAQRAIETAYRFGGFANDCTRLAQGFEQIQLQFLCKAWDLPAALLAQEVGLGVLVDPKATAKVLADWQVQLDNPLIVASYENINLVKACL